MSGRRQSGSQPDRSQFSSRQVYWGIPLREGHSDDDDPSAHKGVIQHAFPIGAERRALCGYEPPMRPWGGRPARPALALASDAYNPPCRQCSALIVPERAEEGE